MLVPPERRGEEASWRLRCVAGERVRGVESMRVGRAGYVDPVTLSLSRLDGDEGIPLAIAAVADDRIAASAVERIIAFPGLAAASESDARDLALKAWVEATPAGVFEVDLQGQRAYWSPEMCRMLGVPVQPPNEWASDVPDHVHPDDRARVEAAIRKSHDPFGDGGFETEHRVRHAGGDVRWLYVKGKTLFEGEGRERRPVRAVGIALDITARKKVEEARLGTLIDVSSHIAWSCDSEGLGVEDSPSWRAFSGQTEEDWKRAGWLAAVHPDDRDSAHAAWEESVRRKSPFDEELRVRHARDEWHWARVRAVPLLNDDDSVRSWVGVCEDITDRKHAELDAARANEREREANALLDAIFAAAPIGLGFWDRDLRFQRINERLAEMNGLPVDAHIGRRLDELLPDIEETDELYLKWREILATGEPWLGIEVRGETPAHPGQPRTWKEDFFPVRVHGEIVGLAAVVQEITERRTAEAQLRESEARFRQMADNAPFMVWVTAPEGACTFLSRSWYEFTGFTPASGLGEGWLAAVHPSDRDWSERAFRDAQQRLEELRIEFRLRRHDGEYRWALQAAAPRFGPGNKFKGYIGSIIDITERKLAEQALESADRRKDEFLATLAHELRNPLAPLTTATELLGRRLPTDPALEQLRLMIERQLEHLTRLVDDLLDTSRITTGRIVLRRQRVDMRDVIGHSLETSGPLTRKRGHSVVSAQPDAPVHVDGDAVRLAQIVTNLLNNAAKFTPPGGRIELSLEEDGRDAVVCVRDDGIGIAAEVLPHLFDRLIRVDQPRDDGSLGLGLSLVKRLVELHGGSVEARSDGAGRGAAFVVRLPLALEIAAAADTPQRGLPPAARRILVVDDNEDAATSLSLLLRHAGHEVRETRDARSALELASRFEPDVVLLDIGLPDMDGWELARALRAQALGGDLKLIAISGYGQHADRRRSLDAGIDRHLTKPVDYAQIAKCL